MADANSTRRYWNNLPAVLALSSSEHLDSERLIGDHVVITRGLAIIGRMTMELGDRLREFTPGDFIDLAALQNMLAELADVINQSAYDLEAERVFELETKVQNKSAG